MPIFQHFLVFVLLMPLLSSAKILKTQDANVAGAHGMLIENKTVWLSDTFRNQNSRSHIYSLSGGTVPLAPQMAGAAGISKHPRKQIYAFSDVMGSEVITVDGSGTELSRIRVLTPWNARWSPSGKSLFAISFSGELTLIDQSTTTTVLKNLDAPFDIAPISDERVWISEQGQHGPGKVCLYKLDSTSQTMNQELCANQTMRTPEGLSSLADGSVLAVDTSKGRLFHVKLNGDTTLLEQGLGVPVMVQSLGAKNWVVYSNRFLGKPSLVWGNF